MLKGRFGLEPPVFHGLDRLKESIAAGHGILLAPNHSRPADPFVMAALGVACQRPVHIMATWYVFVESKLQGFLLPRIGAFSIHRERIDRASIRCAVELLEKARNPVVMFPEGIVSRTNDHLLDFQRGIAHVSRRAARLRKPKGGKVVIHPVFLRYRFSGDLQRSCDSVLQDIATLTGLPDESALPLRDRILQMGQGILSQKETELTGQSATGPLIDRVKALFEHVVGTVERHWFRRVLREKPMERVKAARFAIVKALDNPNLPPEERALCWHHIERLYLAQLLYCYPRDYLAGDSVPPDRLLEIVEHYEEDLTDVARTHAPMQLEVLIGEAIPVEALPKIPRNDPVLDEVRASMENLLHKSSGQTPTDL